MTPEQTLAALQALLAPFNAQLDALDVLAPTVRDLVGTPEAATSQEVADYLSAIATLWPAGIGQESAISDLQVATVSFVDTFWTRLHQAKQLGVSLGYQP